MTGCTTCGHDDDHHPGLLIRPCTVRRCPCTRYRPQVVVHLTRALLLREALATTRLDDGQTISLGPQPPTPEETP